LRTANPTPLLHNAGWSTNGVGRKVSDAFGYGLIDAEAAVRLAEQWVTVPAADTCKANMIPEQIRLHGHFKHRFDITIDDTCNVRYAEHVQVAVALNYSHHGDLRITLQSPAGTKTVLLSPRPRDNNAGMLPRQWPLLSVHTWGEDARGVWTVTIDNTVAQAPFTNYGTFDGWSLSVHGTHMPAQPSDTRKSDLSAAPPTTTDSVLRSALTIEPKDVTQSNIQLPLLVDQSDTVQCNASRRAFYIGMCILGSIVVAILLLLVAYWQCCLRPKMTIKTSYVPVHVAVNV